MFTSTLKGTFGEPENPEQLENPEKPITTSGIMPTLAKPAP